MNDHRGSMQLLGSFATEADPIEVAIVGEFATEADP